HLPGISPRRAQPAGPLQVAKQRPRQAMVLLDDAVQPREVRELDHRPGFWRPAELGEAVADQAEDSRAHSRNVVAVVAIELVTLGDFWECVSRLRQDIL